MILEEKSGDILQAGERYIAQQCNCVTVTSKGIALSIAQKYPWGNPYSTREPISYGRNSSSDSTRDVPGTVRILSDPSASSISDKQIICLFAQWAPGKPGTYSKYYPSNYVDNHSNRLEWFRQCLKYLDDDDVIDSPVAVPFNIGCGLAGGNWTNYREALDSVKTKFIIYRL